MFAINFYSEIFADQLLNRRKTITIRLGDESDKYREGQIVWVTIGQKFGPRNKLFSAIIDKVEVKRVMDLNRREIERENPEYRHIEQVVGFLSQLYEHPVQLEDLVTLIHFSPINE